MAAPRCRYGLALVGDELGVARDLPVGGLDARDTAHRREQRLGDGVAYRVGAIARGTELRRGPRNRFLVDVADQRVEQAVQGVGEDEAP